MSDGVSCDPGQAFREHTRDDNRAHGHDSGTADSTDSSSKDDHPQDLSDAAGIVSIVFLELVVCIHTRSSTQLQTKHMPVTAGLYDRKYRSAVHTVSVRT